MSEFLSQDEIDALLNIADDGAEALEKTTIKSKIKKNKKYTIYDFKKPDTITSDQQKAFESLHDKLIKLFTIDFSAMLRKVVNVELNSIEQMTYGEFVLSIPPITSINTLSLKPLEGRMVVECNPNISRKIISELLGNGQVYQDGNHDKELSDIELEVLNHFYNLLVEKLQETWEDISKINFTTVSQDKNANSIQIISNHEIVLLVTLDITIDNISGNVSLCYPLAYIEQLFDKIIETMLGSARNKKISKKKDLNTLLSGAKMHVEAIIAETYLHAKDILNLTEGNVILFNKNSTSSSAKVYINKKDKFAALSGIMNNRKAIKIISNVDHEKMETINKLKEFREERETKQQEYNEKIARLIETKKDFV